jgi:hypothetical protein
LLLISALLVAWTSGTPLPLVFSRWDVAQFAAIASDGYTELTQAAFFPGLPALMAAGGMIGLPAWLTGTLLALVASGAAAWALYRLAGGGGAGALAVWGWSLAPMAVFSFAAYSEAPFCAGAFWAWELARRGRWGWAGLWASVAMAFRVSGLFLLVGLGIMALMQAWHDRRHSLGRAIGLRAVGLIGPLAVLAAYVVFLKLRFGSWLVWFEAQRQGWGRAFHWPWQAIINTARAAGIGAAGDDNSVMFLAELLVYLIGALLLIWLMRRAWRRWRAGGSQTLRRVASGPTGPRQAYTSSHVLGDLRGSSPSGSDEPSYPLAAAGLVGSSWLALSCQVWLMSLSRSLLIWFPGFVAGAVWLTEASSPQQQRWHRVMAAAILLASTLLMLWWANRFFRGMWAS